MFLSKVYNQISRLNGFYVFLLLAVLGLLAFANAVDHPFVHDDVVFIQENPHLADLNLREIFTRSSAPGHEADLINKYYRPLLELVNRLLYRVIGLEPYGFHLVNIVLHILNGFLVYILVRLIVGSRGLSLAAAVLFLLHPVQNEAVACIAGISNLLFTFLCLLSFYAYLKAMHPEDGKRKSALYLGSLMIFFVALFAKEQSAILPVLLIAYELCFRPEPLGKTFRKYGAAIGGFFVVLAGYFYLRKMLFGFALLRPADSQGELWLRVLAIPRSLLVYLKLIFFPCDLHYYRSQDVLLPFLVPLLGMLAVTLAAAFLICRTSRPQKTWMLFGLAFFSVSLAPVLNIVPLINEFSLILTAEHFLYFPIIGALIFLLAASHYWLIDKMKMAPAFGLLVMGVLSVLFIAMNIRQNTYWRGEIPLFERTLRFEPNFGRARSLLAKAYARAGRYDEAVWEDEKALAIMQGYEQSVRDEEVKDFYRSFIKGIHYHLGYCLDVLGRNKEALAQFKETLNFEPENPAVYYSAGLSYLKMNDLWNAVLYFEKSLALDEGNLTVMNSLAVCYQEVGQYEKAEKLLRTIAEKDSGSVSAQENLKKFLEKKQEGMF